MTLPSGGGLLFYPLEGAYFSPMEEAYLLPGGGLLCSPMEGAYFLLSLEGAYYPLKVVLPGGGLLSYPLEGAYFSPTEGAYFLSKG